MSSPKIGMVANFMDRFTLLWAARAACGACGATGVNGTTGATGAFGATGAIGAFGAAIMKHCTTGGREAKLGFYYVSSTRQPFLSTLLLTGSVWDG